MSNADTPAENTGGNSVTPTAGPLAQLPDRIRVHALAKLLGSSSRELLATLSGLGESIRSAQSSLPRELALRVAAAQGKLDQSATGSDHGTDGAQHRDPVAARVEADSATEGVPATRAPVFAAPAPMFLPPEPAGSPAPQREKETSKPDTEGEGAGGSDASKSDDETDPSGRRRRRRGRRGRGRGKGSDELKEATDTNVTADEPAEATDGGEQGRESGAGDSALAKAENASVQGASGKGDKSGTASDDGDTDDASRRRRRRRRRKGGAEESSEADSGSAASRSSSEDPPNTVVHVRDGTPEPDKSDKDGVRSVRGSTRLEAKRQRRRDGRDAGRRRAPILSESEFLARRESVERAMVVAEKGSTTQVGVLEDGVLVEHFVTAAGSGSIVGNVYLGRVQNVLPSMEAAFVDIGRGRNAVLYAGEVDWDAAGLEGKSRKIEQALATGDSVLVQVTKDPVGHKGARLTTQVSLPGRFLVYVPSGGATGISRKLPENERRRLKDILKRVVPAESGVIIRTASEGISEDELAKDVNRLQAQWEVIRDKAESLSGGSGKSKKSNAPTILYEEPDLLIKVVRDLFTEDFTKLEIQGNKAWETIKAYVDNVASDLSDRLKRYVGTGDVFVDYRIDEQITKALDRKVWLPSGGYLVIDRTEAMTVIDVNTGKFTGSGGNLEETVTRNNLEAAEEVVRQLRLRDIGGIIVIDFIDMVLESNRELVLRRLTECLGRDRTRHQVAEVTSLGLVQMTRKRVGTGLLEAFSAPCEHCKGRGSVVSSEPNKSGGSSSDDGGGSGGHQHSSKHSRAKTKTEQPAPAEANRADPVQPEPTPQQRESAVTAVQVMANASKAAAAKHEDTSQASGQSEAGSADSGRNGHTDARDSESVVATKSADVAEPHASEASESRSPTGGSGQGQAEGTEQGTQYGSVPDQQEGADTGEAGPSEMNVPAPAAGSSTRRRRRAASRPAGPPVSASDNR